MSPSHQLIAFQLSPQHSSERNLYESLPKFVAVASIPDQQELLYQSTDSSVRTHKQYAGTLSGENERAKVCGHGAAILAHENALGIGSHT